MTLQDMEAAYPDESQGTVAESWLLRNSLRLRNKKGHVKIQGFCEVARRHDFTWVWVDTCCIDKTSSAELSEAINSMYLWYNQAATCYVYLADVESLSPRWYLDEESWDTVYRSRWFDRGWTLQELLAPRDMDFFANDWFDLGSKTSLEALIIKRTGIPKDALIGKPLGYFSIAERLSWAAFRETTRKEDIAYCLLGIFDIQMPLLYGEGGEGAFRRLQEELWRRSDDFTLLLWDNSPSRYSINTVFAPHPNCFRQPIQAEILWGSEDSAEKYVKIKSWSSVTYISHGARALFMQHSRNSRPPTDGLQVPPTVSSRGMLVNFFATDIFDYETGDRPLIAWTFCVYGGPDMAVCLSLRREQEIDEPATYWRHQNCILLVPMSEVWKYFKSRQLLLLSSPRLGHAFEYPVLSATVSITVTIPGCKVVLYRPDNADLRLNGVLASPSSGGDPNCLDANHTAFLGKRIAAVILQVEQPAMPSRDGEQQPAWCLADIFAGYETEHVCWRVNEHRPLHCFIRRLAGPAETLAQASAMCATAQSLEGLSDRDAVEISLGRVLALVVRKSLRGRKPHLSVEISLITPSCR